METRDGAAISRVRDAYSRRAKEYASLLGTVESLAENDVALVRDWALDLEGPVLDVGCGPGQWTHLLAGLGVEASGIDPVSAFVDIARAAFPSGRYSAGRAESTGAEDGALGGVLAWYSLIHTEPERVGAALREFRRIVLPGGGLAVGFFEGPGLLPFEHAVTTAYFWPMDLLVGEIENAGFTVTRTETRTDPGARRHGAIIARRS